VIREGKNCCHFVPSPGKNVVEFVVYGINVSVECPIHYIHSSGLCGMYEHKQLSNDYGVY